MFKILNKSSRNDLYAVIDPASSSSCLWPAAKLLQDDMKTCPHIRQNILNQLTAIASQGASCPNILKAYNLSLVLVVLNLFGGGGDLDV